MSTSSFNFDAFLQESRQTLFNPADYFAGMKTGGGLADPIIKSVIYGAVAGFFVFLWSVLHVNGVTGGILGGAVGIMAFIMSIVGAIFALFIGAVIILILSAIAGGNTDFEANARVSASVMVLMPLGSFLSFFSGISLVLGAIVSLLINLYGAYLIYQALTKTLKARENTSRIISFVLAAIAVVIMITAISTRRIAKKYMKDFESRNEQMLDEMNNTMGEATKEIPG